jgi:IclR family mhp operon transcriptional activator
MADNEKLVVRGTLRAFSVLRALNDHNGSTVSELSVVTGISRPALYRILDTLVAAGYVCRDDSEKRFLLTIQVRALSDGYRDEEWVSKVALPHLRTLQEEIVWPVDLASFLDDAMYIRETTREKSPLTLDRRRIGYKVPMLLSASGRAYLAYCPEAERNIIIANLARSSTFTDRIAKDRALIGSVLLETRRNGYGQRFRELEPHSGGIAVPIMYKRRVMACICVTFFANSTTPTEMAKKHLSAMSRTARQIELGLNGLFDAKTDVAVGRTKTQRKGSTSANAFHA